MLRIVINIINYYFVKDLIQYRSFSSFEECVCCAAGQIPCLSSNPSLALSSENPIWFWARRIQYATSHPTFKVHFNISLLFVSVSLTSFYYRFHLATSYFSFPMLFATRSSCSYIWSPFMANYLVKRMTVYYRDQISTLHKFLQSPFTSLFPYGESKFQTDTK